jgi:Peptidase_C39 like family
VERMVRAGIPVVASITFGRGRLRGAPISATNGHLLVVVGFTRAGNVVVNDPAARTRAGVRRTYDRGQFEDAWLKRYPSNGRMRGSGGLGYVIRDAAHPLPARTGNTNW